MDVNDTPGGEPGTVTDSAVEKPTVDALADILADPDDTDTGQTEAHAEDDNPDSSDTGDEGAASAEDSGDEANPDQQGGSQAADGRFVEHNARVRLPNGETTTVAELTKGYFRQSDYTRKSQENAELRKALEGDKQRSSQTTQQLQSQLDRMSAMLEQWKPRPPQDKDDYAGWIQYQQQAEAFQQWQDQIDTEAKQLSEKREAETAEENRARMIRENGMLVEKFSAMADPAKRAAFLGEAVNVLGKYGFSREDVGSINDHRLILVIRDLMRAERLTAKAPQVAAQIKEKPKMVRGGKRGSDTAADAKRQKIDRLRETGSRADARRALMDLDL